MALPAPLLGVRDHRGDRRRLLAIVTAHAGPRRRRAFRRERVAVHARGQRDRGWIGGARVVQRRLDVGVAGGAQLGRRLDEVLDDLVALAARNVGRVQLFLDDVQVPAEAMESARLRCSRISVGRPARGPHTSPPPTVQRTNIARHVARISRHGRRMCPLSASAEAQSNGKMLKTHGNPVVQEDLHPCGPCRRGRGDRGWCGPRATPAGPSGAQHHRHTPPA